MANTNLANAKTAKNDEFYTQYADIQKEINAYLDYNPDVFRNKTVLLPCDDPEWSNFTKFFAQNFQLLGLKKLISTSYAPESKKYKMPYQPTLFETSQPHYNVDKSKTHGKIFVLERDITGDNRIDIKPSIIKKQEIIWKFQNIFLSLQRERWNQVEPRCAERWHLCDDEQFDLAAWFHKHSAHHSIERWAFSIFTYRFPLNSFLSIRRVAVMKFTSFTCSRFTFIL